MEIFPTQAAAATMNLIRRTLRDLLPLLPSLPVTASCEPDYVEANPDLLVSLADFGELALQIVHGGFLAIGLFQVSTAQQIADGKICVEYAAALGRLLVELGEVLLYVHGPSVDCRRLHRRLRGKRNRRWRLI